MAPATWSAQAHTTIPRGLGPHDQSLNTVTAHCFASVTVAIASSRAEAASCPREERTLDWDEPCDETDDEEFR
jgi:hypothetical protein